MAAAAGGGGPVGPQAAGAAPAPVPGPGAVLIGDRLYSGVLITLENCLLPEHTLRFTPSMSSGLDPDTETELRVTGCELIQAAGILLRLPQVGLGGRWEGAGIQPGPSLYGARCSGSRPGRPRHRPGLGARSGPFPASGYRERAMAAPPPPPPCEDRGLCKAGFLELSSGGVVTSAGFCFLEDFIGQTASLISVPKTFTRLPAAESRHMQIVTILDFPSLSTPKKQFIFTGLLS